ncbi:MAG: hypothetical protein IT170_05145 [Bryobacterales bacterium]|nr:hypothetical protein [Bryobacterales bacterium]
MPPPTQNLNSSEFAPELFLRELKAAARTGEFPVVETLLNDYEARSGRDAFYAESLSWVARATASKGFSTEARAYARDAYALAHGQLKEEIVPASSSLALALSAAIEVEADLLLSGDGATAAVAYLHRQLEIFDAQPFRMRIRKSLHSISLAGEPAPTLDWTPLPNSAPGSETLFSGPCLLFFWAHWCSDSRTQARAVARVRQTFGEALTVVAPTRLFGFTTKGNLVEEAVELAHLQEIRQIDYPDLGTCPIPFGIENFDRYGASTIPTMAGIRADGSVAFYHAGILKAEDLEKRLREFI